MKNLVQIIYISRSTFIPTETSNEIEPNVARILMKSRVNNKNNGLVGVLYFGDGCFFQCLEGEETAVDTLYAKLMNDPRHENLKIISRKKVDKLHFSEWAMKYVPLEAKMSKLLKDNGMDKFDPYVFDTKMIESVLGLLQLNNNITLPDEKIETPALSTTVNNNDNKNMYTMAKYAFAFSITAVVIAVYLALSR